MKKFLRGLIRSVLKMITKVEATGYENLPPEGGFVIAVNHLGFLDFWPLVAGSPSIMRRGKRSMLPAAFRASI